MLTLIGSKSSVYLGKNWGLSVAVAVRFGPMSIDRGLFKCMSSKIGGTWRGVLWLVVADVVSDWGANRYIFVLGTDMVLDVAGIGYK